MNRVKSWRAPISEVTNMKKVIGDMPGSVIWRNLIQLPAPSTVAASYSYVGTLPSADRYRMMLTPRPPHTP